MKMCKENSDAAAVAEPIAEVDEESQEDKNAGKIMVFGLNLKDPQDLITIGLTGLIVYNTVDLVMYYAGKLFAVSS
jgi:hypothetical protein